MIHFRGGDGYGKKTETAGTRIQKLLGGYGGSSLFTHVLNMRYTAQGTAHTLTLMRGASRGRVASDLAAAGTALVSDVALTDGAGNAPANLDFVAVRLDNGDWHLSRISAWSAATLTLTLETAIPTGRTAKKGARIVMYGVAGDAMHADRQFTGTASATTNFPVLAGQELSLCRATAPGEPILFDSDNATAAGTLEYAQVGYGIA